MSTTGETDATEGESICDEGTAARGSGGGSIEEDGGGTEEDEAAAGSGEVTMFGSAARVGCTVGSEGGVVLMEV